MPAELQRFFTSKINGLNGHSPFHGKILRNKKIRQSSLLGGSKLAGLTFFLLLLASAACLWSARSRQGVTTIIRLGRKGFRH